VQEITLIEKKTLKKILNQPLIITLKIVLQKKNPKVYENPYKMFKIFPKNPKII
jgi:hypothetical protein